MWGKKIQASCLHLFTLHLFASLISVDRIMAQATSWGVVLVQVRRAPLRALRGIP
jgi:hypothetical protein